VTLQTKSLTENREIEPLLFAGARSFRELVSQAKGMYPTELLQFLECRPKDNGPMGRIVQTMIVEARSFVVGGNLPQGDGLALPHPIDAEWRFTEETARSLIENAVAATGAGESILLMGVPSVALAAARSSHDRLFWVRGEPNVITEGLKSLTAADARFCHDISDLVQAGAAILDPPWYVTQFRAMLSQASHHCRTGAHLFVSAPPEGVRPGIAYDLRELSEVATQSGLELASEDAGALIYRTPFFEVNALRAAGIGAWLPDWRRGNLTIYRKRDVGRSYPIATTLPAFELTLAGVRLRLLTSGSTQEAGLIPLYRNEVFPSVSMRALRRSEAALWTSGNRAFAIERRSALTALAAMARDRNLLPKGLSLELFPMRNSQAIDVVEPLIQKLNELVDREFAEAASAVGPAAWDTSANDARFLNAY
jgi:hypothetical protein